jgi:hypothetical protein
VTLFPEPHHLRFWYGTDELFVRQVNIDPPENIVTATLQPSHGARQTRAGDFLILDVVEPAKTTQHVLQVTVAVHEETGTIVRARCLGPTARPSLVKPSDPREAELWATNLDPELHQGLTPEEVRDRTEDGRNRIFPTLSFTPDEANHLRPGDQLLIQLASGPTFRVTVTETGLTDGITFTTVDLKGALTKRTKPRLEDELWKTDLTPELTQGLEPTKPTENQADKFRRRTRERR